METTFYNLLDNLEQYLEYQRDNGVVRVEVDRAVFQSLRQSTVSVSTPAPAPVEYAKIPTSFSNYTEWQTQLARCRNCSLGQGRVIQGIGCTEHPEIVFVDETPPFEISDSRTIFKSASGKLLLKMIEAMGLGLDTVFVTYAVKCAPQKDQFPKPEQQRSCQPLLLEQIRLLNPKVVVAMGAVALRNLVDDSVVFTHARGSWQSMENIQVMPTYRPATLLRDGKKKKETWNDLKQVLAALGKKPPTRK